MDELTKTKTGNTRHRHETAMKDKAFDSIRNLPMLETQSSHFLKTLELGTVSTNVYLRRVHRGEAPRASSSSRNLTHGFSDVFVRIDAKGIEVVAEDILALTKLNYNSCRYADGLPVTLRFADAVGEILVSGPIKPIPLLAFRYYI